MNNNGVVIPDGRRRDIQGLRAVAVLMVVSFHAGLPIPGGFAGVDIFFVVSGFVITSMLHRKRLRDGRLEYAKFYWSRFKRLMPALSLVVSVTVVVSIVMLSPFGPQQTAAKTGIGAIMLAANVVIARSTGDYFDAPAEMNPLLQTWSLSVEEQFYLMFPAVLGLSWLIAKRFRRFFIMPYFAVGVIALISMGLVAGSALGLLPMDAHAFSGFYSPLSRAWEFAVGALLALLLATNMAVVPIVRAGAGAVGALMIVASGWLINEETVFPGKWTLLPVMGTVFLLVAGSGEGSWIGRKLSARPMVKIGDWSYSLYLWHWPFAVFAALIWPFAVFAPLVACVLSFPVSIASYRLLEQPLRWHTFRSTSRALASASIVVVVPIVLSVTALSLTTALWQPRYETGDMPIAHSGTVGTDSTFNTMRNDYFPCPFSQVEDQAQFHLGLRRCLQSKKGQEVDLVILGDSHAEHLFIGLSETFAERNIAYVYLDAWPTRSTENSTETFRQVADRSSIKSVVLASYWSSQAFGDNLDQEIRSLVQSGKRVFVTDDVPDYPFDALACKFKQGLIGQPTCSRAAKGFWQIHDAALAPVREAIANNPSAQLVETARYFCGLTECSMVKNDRLLYADSHHLNVEGSRFLASQLARDYPQMFSLGE